MAPLNWISEAIARLAGGARDPEAEARVGLEQHLRVPAPARIAQDAMNAVSRL